MKANARPPTQRGPGMAALGQAIALACLWAGMDVYSLQKLMGHADLSALRRYLGQNEADLQTAHARAGPVDNVLRARTG